MTWEDAHDRYVLETGTLVPTPCGILGINPSATIWAGGDCTINAARFTPAEKQEIARYAIARWKEWASAL